jgi:hypothetical protein
VAAPSLDYSATDWYSAEELLILLINFMKKMKSEQAVLPNLCLEEEKYLVSVKLSMYLIKYYTMKTCAGLDVEL